MPGAVVVRFAAVGGDRANTVRDLLDSLHVQVTFPPPSLDPSGLCILNIVRVLQLELVAQMKKDSATRIADCLHEVRKKRDELFEMSRRYFLCKPPYNPSARIAWI